LKRKKTPIAPVRSSKRGVNQKRYQSLVKRENPYDMYAKRKSN